MSEGNSKVLSLLHRGTIYTQSVSGTDKVFRTVQYISQLIPLILLKTGYNNRSALIQSCNNLSSPLAETRVILRLLGMIPTVQGLMESKVSSCLEKSHVASISLIEWLEWSQLISLALYYPFEHLYWLHCRKILSSKLRDPDALSRWSCQAWAVYILLDLCVMFIKYRKNEKVIKSLILEGKRDEKEVKELRAKQKELVWSIIYYFGDLPLALHWSVVKSPLSPLTVNLCGLFSSLHALVGKWKATK